MFKAQPHLIDNIQDREAAARLRSVLHKSPFVVTNRSTCWLDVVDLAFLRDHYVTNYSKHYPNTFGDATETPPKLVPKKKAIDLLDEFKNAPPALINRPLVSPISLHSEQMELTLKKTISNVGFFGHKYMDRLGLHTTLDKHYLDLLPALYTSNQQTLYHEKACSHRCTGKAIFTVPAAPAVMDERISNATQQNREQILPYIESPSISTELCSNMIFLQCMGNKLLMYFSTHLQDSAEKAKLVDSTMEVFFHLVNTCDERPMLIYPPAKKTLRPLIRDLASKFVGLHPEFSSRFLGSIVSHPERVLWLHPYWQPVFFNFDDLCELITKHYVRVQHIDTDRLVMPLLQKFDFIQWLQVAPTIVQVRRVISILGKGIAAQNGAKYSIQLTTNPGWLFLHNAFKLVCGHKIFEAYLEYILPILLEHSKAMSLPPEVWWGFLELPFQQYISETQIMATFEALSAFFWSMRAVKQHSSTPNLYTSLLPYIPTFVAFTKKLLSSPFATSNPLFVGNGIMEVYEPWVSRMDENSQHTPLEQFPWVPAQNAEAHLVVTGLVECITALLDAYPQTFDNFMVFFLSKMAPYKTPEILELPWYKWFIPTNSLLLLLNTIRAIPVSTNNYLTASGEPPTNPLPVLLCEIIATIDWGIALSRADNQLDFLLAFVRLILFAMFEHPNPIETKFGSFLQHILSFEWTLLTPQSYEQLVSDCLAIVQKSQHTMQAFSASKTPKGRTVEFQKWTYLLSLMRCIALSETPKQDAQQILNVSLKVTGFIEVVVYLLGLPQFEYWRAHDPIPYIHDVMGIMKVRFKLLVPFPEGVPCISKTLRTFLAINNSPVIQERLQNSTVVSCDLLREVPYLAIEFLQAAQQTIFALNSLSQLVEHSLEVYFGLFAPPNPPVDSLVVPELENKEFLADCIKRGFSYTLYIYCLQQIVRKSPLKMLCASVWEWESYIPVDTLGEKCHKILPLWTKSAILIYFLFKESNDRRLIEQANTLAGKIYKFGEAKKSDGFLGAIGLGEKSNLPPAFRYMCKALSLFIHLQASPSDNSFTFRTHQPHLPLTRFHKFLPILEKNFVFVTSGVLREKEFAGVPGMPQAVGVVGKFLGDEGKTMQDVEALVGCLGEVLYPNAKVFIHLKDMSDTKVCTPDSLLLKNKLAAATMFTYDSKTKGLTVTQKGEVKYKKRSGSHIVTIRTSVPWKRTPKSTMLYYYEVEIRSTEGGVGVGIADSSLPINGMLPGWQPKSYAYLGDSGNRFCDGKAATASWPEFGEGDVVGIGLKGSTGEIFATLNGKLLGLLATVYDEREYFPTVGLMSSSDLTIQFDLVHFQFGITTVLKTDLVPSFGPLDTTERTTDKFLILYLQGIEKSKQEELKTQLEKIAKAVRRTYNYQSLYTTNAATYSKVFAGYIGAYNRSPLLLAKNVSQKTEYALPAGTEITSDAIWKMLEDIDKGDHSSLALPPNYSPRVQDMLANAERTSDATARVKMLNDAQGYALMDTAYAESFVVANNLSKLAIGDIKFIQNSWASLIESELNDLLKKSAAMTHTQPTDNHYPDDTKSQVEYFIRRAIYLKSRFEEELNGAVISHRGKVKIGPVKEMVRCLAKIREDGANPTQIYDYLRATATFGQVLDVLVFIGAFEKGRVLLRTKSRLAEKAEGNRCILVNFHVGDSYCRMIAELQITTNEIAQLNVVAHKSYKEARVAPKQAPKPVPEVQSTRTIRLLTNFTKK